MNSPESCKGCYREQTCELWKSTPLRQDIEAEGCDYYSNHAPTNGDRARSMSNEELAGIMQCKCPPGTECSRSIDYPCATCWLDWLNKTAEKPEKPEKSSRQTNFARITEKPEALAEEMVFYHDGLWGFIRHNVPVIRMKHRETAVAIAVEYLRQEVKE